MANKQLNNLLDNLKTKNFDKIKTWLDTVHPVDLAEILTELKDEEILAIYELMDYEQLAEMIEEADEKAQIRLLKLLDLDEIIQVFSYMSADNITDIMGNLPFNETKQLLKMMKEENAGTIRHLLGYYSDTAGGLMTTEFIALKENLTTTEALLKIKQIGPKTEIIETIFVVDESKRLVGTVDLRDILVAPDDQPLKEITDYNVISVLPGTDQEKVAMIVSKYDLTVIPVVNRRGVLIGIITVDDIIDVIEAENTEDMFKMVGINDEEQVISPVRISIRKRLPWLYVNLITAFTASFTIGLFEDVIAQVVILATFLPIVAGLGGNSGQQSLAVMIRGLALGEIDFKNSKETLFKEILIGLINGTAIGIVTGLIAYFWRGNFFIGLVIFLAMVINMVIGALMGSLIPLGLKAVGIDPALASSIFLTATTDTFGFLIFLLLSSLFLKFMI
ncbi:magnesium transporter [Anoxybacter fermentans]|uniref:Magnesium transporter MgtE n=1 Tax=Anoxybacter fermentans TaxID=1323375 RepID=A0A3Q9HSB4_9FIRM|nr:magnesium transporter [Anoxybacter fermentans]AZR74650.1 magnesium transporter [Anoxybacter fermentans]